MKKCLRLAAFVSVLFLIGCATPYQARGLTGGFSETRVDDNTYQVKFFGNGNTSSDKVWYYWIYRCAELTKSKGYTAFALISDKPTAPKTDKSSQAFPSLRPAAMSSEDDSGYAGAKGGGSYYVPSYGGGTITAYSASAFVRFLKEPIPDHISYFQAQVILNVLKPYIDSEGNFNKVQSRADLLSQALVIGRTAMATGELPNSTGNATLDDYKGLLPSKQ